MEPDREILSGIEGIINSEVDLIMKYRDQLEQTPLTISNKESLEEKIAFCNETIKKLGGVCGTIFQLRSDITIIEIGIKRIKRI